MIAKGNVIYLYFQGEIHAIVEDDTLPDPGQVGLFGWVNAGSPVGDVGGAVFDDFVVSSVGEPTDVVDWSLY